MKKCTACQVEKDESDFYFRNSKNKILTSYCKACKSKSRKTYLEKNKDKISAIAKKRYARIHTKTCAICGTKFLKKGKFYTCSVKCKILANIEKQNGCWIWTGNKFNSGYGLINTDSKARSAHRVSYETFNGPIPNGQLVCHKCDNKLCVNPDHLWLGTYVENMQDCKQKFRNTHGERNSKCKYTDIQIEEMRLLKEEGFTTARLARIFNCDQSYAQFVCRYKIRKRKTVDPTLMIEQYTSSAPPEEYRILI